MSTPEITITLGRSSQIVKRKRTDFDRFASNRDASSSSRSKRQRDAAVKGNVGHVGENGLHLDRNDLRYKLIQRRLSSESPIAASGIERRAELKGEFSGAPTRSSISSNVLQHGAQCHQDRRVQRDPYRETARDLHYVDSSRDYSTVTRDDLRQRSPARLAYNSGGLFPSTDNTDKQKVTPIRSVEPFGCRLAYRNSLSGSTRSTVSANVMSLMEAETSDTMPRGLFMAEAPVTVTGLLNSLGLGKYAIHFQAEEVDMTVLKQMGEKDLKDLGIPMGPRKKIIQALSTLFKRQLARATVVR